MKTKCKTGAMLGQKIKRISRCAQYAKSMSLQRSQRKSLSAWLVLLLSITVMGFMDYSTLSASTMTRTLSWTAPTLDAEGNPLEEGELAGYYLYYGNAPENFNHVIDIANPATTSYQFQNLAEQDWYFAMTAYSKTSNLMAGCSSDGTTLRFGRGRGGTDVHCTDSNYNDGNAPTIQEVCELTYGMTCIEVATDTVHQSVLSNAISILECASFDYTAWAACQDDINTRTVTASYASGCYAGTPVIERSCPFDNADPDVTIVLQKIVPHMVIPKGLPYRVRYSLSHPSEDITFTVKFDTSNSGYNGVADENCQGLSDGLQEECQLNTDIPPGTYFLYGESTSAAGENRVYLPNSLTISPCDNGKNNHACAGTVAVGQ